jgi:hypothetical protein
MHKGNITHSGDSHARSLFMQGAEHAISVAAYTLVEHLRPEDVADTEWDRSAVNAIRSKLFRIGAGVVRAVQRMMFHRTRSYPLKKPSMEIAVHLKEPVNTLVAFDNL